MASFDTKAGVVSQAAALGGLLVLAFAAGYEQGWRAGSYQTAGVGERVLATPGWVELVMLGSTALVVVVLLSFAVPKLHAQWVISNE